MCRNWLWKETVLAAALIARKQAKTVILVHNKQLLEQWLERLADFLEFDEEKAVRAIRRLGEKRLLVTSAGMAAVKDGEVA